MSFVGKGIPVEDLMSVNGILLVAVSWEAVGGLASVMGCARLPNKMLLGGLDTELGVDTAFVQHYCMAWEEWVKVPPHALDVLGYLCHSVSALKPAFRCPK